MNIFKKFRFAYLFLAAMLLLVACVPTSTNNGATIDATQAAEMIEDAVAQALGAQATQNAETIPQPTATLAVTNTAIPAQATLTPFPTITPLVLVSTATPVSSGGGSYTPKEYDCVIVSSQPPPTSASVFNKNATFDINITIKNTGTAVWPAGYDLTFHNSASSTNLAPGTSIFRELPEVLPGETYTIGPFDGVAPDKKGHYVMTFRLEGEFCWPYVYIDVK